jgi:hypothetical protein
MVVGRASALWVAVLLLTLVGGGCESAVSTYLDCSCCLDDEDLSTPDLAPADAVTPEEAGDTGPVGPAPQVGQPCTANGECELGLCLSDEFLAGLGVENENIHIPDGMCSKMPCAKDEDCGPNGICFNTQPFTGTPIAICLVGCERMAGCRWEEGYSCYQHPKDPEDPEAGMLSACLPDSLVVAVECDDGHCEGMDQTMGHCDELADCFWKEGYHCLVEADAEEGICVPDSTVVALECEDGSCPMPEPAGEEETP